MENPYKQGDEVKLISVNNTLGRWGGNEERASKLIGDDFIVDMVRGNEVRLLNDPIAYCWHWLDFKYVAEANRLVKPPPPPPVPEWVQPFVNMPCHGANIHYILYRPRKGDKASKITWKELQKRGYNLLHHKDDHRYDTWINGNSACFASLPSLQPNWKDKWKGYPPTWIILDLQYKYENRLSLMDYEILNWIHVLVENGVLPKECKGEEWVKDGTIRFRLRDYSLTKLFAMLCFIRNAHESQWIVRQTLYLMAQGMNFFVAYALTHAHGFRGNDNHDTLGGGYFLSSYPCEIVSTAYKLEHFIKKGDKRKTAYTKSSTRQRFALHDTIHATKAKTCDDKHMSYVGMRKIQPLYK